MRTQKTFVHSLTLALVVVGVSLSVSLGVALAARRSGGFASSSSACYANPCLVGGVRDRQCKKPIIRTSCASSTCNTGPCTYSPPSTVPRPASTTCSYQVPCPSGKRCPKARTFSVPCGSACKQQGACTKTVCAKGGPCTSTVY